MLRHQLILNVLVWRGRSSGACSLNLERPHHHAHWVVWDPAAPAFHLRHIRYFSFDIIRSSQPNLTNISKVTLLSHHLINILNLKNIYWGTEYSFWFYHSILIIYLINLLINQSILLCFLKPTKLNNWRILKYLSIRNGRTNPGKGTKKQIRCLFSFPNTRGPHPCPHESRALDSEQ